MPYQGNLKSAQMVWPNVQANYRLWETHLNTHRISYLLFYTIPPHATATQAASAVCAVHFGHRRRKDRRRQGCAQNTGFTKAARQISESANYFASSNAHFLTSQPADDRPMGLPVAVQQKVAMLEWRCESYAGNGERFW